MATTKKTTRKKAATSKKAPAKKATSKKATSKKAISKKAPAKKAVPSAKAAVSGAEVTPKERWKMIAEAAYYLAEQRGFQGDTVSDWLDAEQAIDAQLARG